MKKLVVFDFDGTLINTIVNVYKNMNKALTLHDFQTFTLDEYKNIVGGNIDEIIFKLLSPFNNSESNVKLIKKTYLELIKQNKDEESVPFEGMYELLKKIQENDIYIAINSNRYTYSIEEYVNKFFKNINFKIIEGHNPPNPSKPDPYGVNHILNHLNIQKEDAVYIGDSITDLNTAKNSNIDFILVNWGYPNGHISDDEYILKDVNEPNEIFNIIIK